MIIFCTFHPASVLDGGWHLESYIREDFKRFSQKQLRPPIKKLPRASTDVIGFDTEYSPDGSLLTVGLSDTQRACAIELTEHGSRKRIASIVKRAKYLVGHSVDGDLDYLVKLKLAKESWLKGINVKDSFLLARMADENKGRGGYGLEPLLLSHFNFKEWKTETAALLKKTGNAMDWTPAQRTERCRLDSWATLILANKLYPVVLRKGQDVAKVRLT